jgi:RHS repeat-associated protein
MGSLTLNTTPAVDANTNRFGTGFVYDKNGNITQDGQSTSTRSFTFNGDNKQIQVKNNAGTPIGTYYYDGEGKRIKKVTDSETTVFVYDGSGKLIAEYSNQISSTPTVSYTTTDHLGSPRVITDKNGSITSRRDFMPFGEELNAGTPNRTESAKYALAGDGLRKKFTGYEKDNETGLDFAEVRYYQNLHGRFTTVDPLLASGKSANPQTFNRYIYVGGNPVNVTDPQGLEWYWNKSTNKVDFYDEKTKKFHYGGGEISDAWTQVVGSSGEAGSHIYKNTEGEGYVVLDPYSKNYLKVSELGEGQTKFDGLYQNSPEKREFEQAHDARAETNTTIVSVHAAICMAPVLAAGGSEAYFLAQGGSQLTSLGLTAAETGTTSATTAGTNATIHGGQRLLERAFRNLKLCLREPELKCSKETAREFLLKKLETGNSMFLWKAVEELLRH